MSEILFRIGEEFATFFPVYHSIVGAAMAIV
jgi:hypothetical protein